MIVSPPLLRSNEAIAAAISAPASGPAFCATDAVSMFMYPQIAEKNWSPSAEDMAAMTRCNIELREARVLLALDGLRPSSEGASVVFKDSEARIVDGPSPRPRR